ncbi:class I SAM-dependent RNA methyltransferase [Primorskyibacter flagellatus]|uniref:class I SAM-dependent RNA methyltransferase n=1 Tax=Primorskyibacter flagellatus TaxID=1387277 RepID=UPI003A932323
MTTVTIERLGHHGDGIAAGPIYVPRTLPGEVVEGDVVGDAMPQPRIVTSSPDRVKAPCRHAAACGGCQLQHVSNRFVTDWKLGIVTHALAAHGLEVQPRRILTSPPSTRRRAGFSARRTKKGAMAGFHKRGADVIVGVPDCLLVDPAIAAALPMVEALAIAGTSRKAELSVMVTTSLGGLDVAVTGGKEADPQLQMQLAAIAEKFDLARLTWDDDLALTRRMPEQQFGPARVTPPAGAFLQATPEGESALLAAVTEAVGGAARIVDLFAGCGTFALPLARAAAVHAVEGDAAMVRALDAGWRKAPLLHAVTHATRDLFRAPLDASDLKGFDAAVIDPPRAGSQAQIAELAKSGIPVIAHVSCNPVTFARDAKMLVDAGYRIDWIDVVDQFRWSTHVELVAGFTLNA